MSFLEIHFFDGGFASFFYLELYSLWQRWVDIVQTLPRCRFRGAKHLDVVTDLVERGNISAGYHPHSSCLLRELSCRHRFLQLFSQLCVAFLELFVGVL